MVVVSLCCLGTPQDVVRTTKGSAWETTAWQRTVMVRVYSRDSDILLTQGNHKASLKDPKKKAVPLLIPYGDDFLLAQQEPVPQGEGDDPALELAKKMSLDAHQEKGEGEGADADIE
ncbi:hypothetical protein Tco_1334292 [Tanacetum coccineum]